MTRLVVVSILFLFLFAESILSQGIAISPARLQFELYRGETAESILAITNPGDQEVSYLITAEDYPDWITFSEPEGILSPGEVKEINIKINPSPDVSNGEYDTLISVSFDTSVPYNQLTLGIATAIKTKIIITGSQVVNLLVNNLELQDTEQGLPVLLTIELLNKGNVRTQPTAEIIVKKNGRILTRSVSVLTENLPGSRTLTYRNISTETLEPGEYTVLFRLSLDGQLIKEESIPLKIYPYGTFSRLGLMSNLSLKEAPRYGEIALLIADFENQGLINLRAKLISDVFLDGTLANRIEGDEMLVRSHEAKQLTAYVKLDSAGTYLIRSKILFEGEETPVQELKFVVQPPALPGPNPLTGMLIASSIVLIGILLFYRKEVIRMVRKQKILRQVKPKSAKPKIYYCIDCNRKINHKGRCLSCNLKARLHLEAQDRKYRE